jgi:hypothetical protein
VKFRILVFTVLIAILALGISPSVQAQENTDEQIVTDAYVYLLGRALVIRQERTDLKEPGVAYNVIKYNPMGSADFVNPNLDVAYLEAWIAVDDTTPVLLEVPEVRGRYYTAQILDEWGEVITNINERTYPSHPHGKFFLVAPGSRVTVPADAVRIELHSRKAKMLARVELQDSPEQATRLQKQFTLKALGRPVVLPPPELPSFGNKDLMGVEIFDNADAILSSALDVSPMAAQMQARVRDIGQQVKYPGKRKALDKLIREQIVPQFLNRAAMKVGAMRNNWVASLGTGNYGENYWARSAANLVGIWANNNNEAVYFVLMGDEEGKTPIGSNDYLIHFPAGERPDAMVNAYWSVILVDVPDYRVVPNPLNRFNFNNYSALKTEADGSLKILVAPKPNGTVAESNWLPAPAGKPFCLTLRTYVPKDKVKRGEWFPPVLKKVMKGRDQ